MVKSDNIKSQNMYTEQIVLKKAKLKRIDLKKAKLYILIPPCKLCAQKKYLKTNLAQPLYPFFCAKKL